MDGRAILLPGLPELPLEPHPQVRMAVARILEAAQTVGMVGLVLRQAMVALGQATVLPTEMEEMEEMAATEHQERRAERAAKPAMPLGTVMVAKEVTVGPVADPTTRGQEAKEAGAETALEREAAEKVAREELGGLGTSKVAMVAKEAREATPPWVAQLEVEAEMVAPGACKAETEARVAKEAQPAERGVREATAGLALLPGRRAPKEPTASAQTRAS